MGNIVQPLWAECPACTRIIVAGYPLLSMALSIAEQAAPTVVAMGFDCTLFTVVKRWWVWTMITGAFFRPFANGMAFLFMLFEVYMGMQLFPTKEKELGSLCFAFWVCLMNFCVNVIFLSTMYILSAFQQNMMSRMMYWMLPNQGLWPLVFIAISLQVLADPDGSTSFWGVVSIPNKWYPLCLLGFFSLMSQGIMWNCAAAVLIGYLYPRLRLERLLPGRVRANRWETRCCGGCCNNPICWCATMCLSGTWLMAADTSGYEIESGDRRYATVSDFGRSGMTQLSNQRNSDQQASQPAPSTQFVAFAGSGNRLGDGGEAAVALNLPSAPPQEMRSVPADP